jgi:hypothetical protein
MAQWRKVQAAGILLLDTTVKSGDPVFAPNWEIVRDVKDEIITPEEYTAIYQRMMAESFRTHSERWRQVIREPRPQAIACYCRAGKFCHRHLLLSYFELICTRRQIEFEYRGEFDGRGS